MGNEKKIAKKKDFENYYNCISSLKTRIGDLALKNTQNDIDELKIFFVNLQTKATRNGIFITLNSIQNIPDYRIFISMCSELINVNIEFDNPSADVMGEGPYTFFYFIYQNPKKVKDVLNCAYRIYSHFKKNTHKVLEYLFRLGESLIICHSEYDENLTTYMDFFIRRAENFLLGFCTIQRLLVNMHHNSFITILTSIENMIPTNGDMHCGGKVPYFITDSINQFIYKPRDMRLDTIIMELLAFSNTFLEEKIKLPVLATYLLPDNTGFMDIAVHAQEMDEEQAKSYFLKFGALLCFAKLFGIDDLHYENIMATEQGPIIIDLECALNPNSIRTKVITDKALGFLKQAFISKKRENATFLVNNNIFPLTYWKEYIYEGFAKAAQCFKNHTQEFIDKYSDFMHQPYSYCYRIVPIITGEFYIHMHSMINEPSFITQQRINDICQSTIEYLNKFIFNNMIQNHLNLNLLFQNIYYSMRSGEIPLFQLSATIDTKENIYYMGYINNQPFFKNPIIVNTLSAFKKELEHKINWLNSDEAMSSLIKFITY